MDTRDPVLFVVCKRINNNNEGIFIALLHEVSQIHSA